MADHNAACACLRVHFIPFDNADGSKTEHWQCAHCGSEFVRRPLPREYAIEAEALWRDDMQRSRDRLTRELAAARAELSATEQALQAERNDLVVSRRTIEAERELRVRAEQALQAAQRELERLCDSLEICRNLTRNQEQSPGTVRQVGIRVAQIVSAALAAARATRGQGEPQPTPQPATGKAQQPDAGAGSWFTCRHGIRVDRVVAEHHESCDDYRERYLGAAASGKGSVLIGIGHRLAEVAREFSERPGWTIGHEDCVLLKALSDSWAIADELASPRAAEGAGGGDTFAEHVHRKMWDALNERAERAEAERDEALAQRDRAEMNAAKWIEKSRATEAERDEQRKRADQYEQDWMAAKHEFFVDMGKMRTRAEAAESRAAAAEAAREEVERLLALEKDMHETTALAFAQLRQLARMHPAEVLADLKRTSEELNACRKSLNDIDRALGICSVPVSAVSAICEIGAELTQARARLAAWEPVRQAGEAWLVWSSKHIATREEFALENALKRALELDARPGPGTKHRPASPSGARE